MLHKPNAKVLYRKTVLDRSYDPIGQQGMWHSFE